MSMRQFVFALNMQIIWFANDYALYWLYIDNIWMHNHTKRMIKKQTQKSYWYCKWWKKNADIKLKKYEKRAKRIRLTDFCCMKLIMIKRFDETTDN